MLVPSAPARLPARIGWGSLFLVSVSLFLITGLAFSLGILGLGFLLAILAVSVWEFRAWFIDQRPLIDAMKARPALPESDPDLIRMVVSLSDRAGIPTPRVFISDQPEANALAIATRSGGMVMVSRQTLTLLTSDELAAVLAHEIGHLKNRDSMWQILVRILVKAVLAPAAFLLAIIAIAGYFSDEDNDGEFGVALWGLFAMVGALISTMVIAFSSRSRELMADQSAVDLGTAPDSLISALEKMEAVDSEPTDLTLSEALVAPTMFVNPLRESWSYRLVASHPSIEKRAKKLYLRLPPVEKEVSQARVTAARERHAYEQRIAEWRQSVEAAESQLDFARRVVAWQPGERERAVFGLRRDELIFMIGSAGLVQVRRSQGGDVFKVTRAGEAVVTTKGLVFAADRRTRFNFSEIIEQRWLDHYSVILPTTSRQRPSGVVFDEEQTDWRTVVAVAEAECWLARDELESQLASRVEELRRERPAANPEFRP